MEYNEEAILKALIYHDIFSYPLTREEVWQYAIGSTVLHKKKFFVELDHSLLVQKKQQFYFLKNKKHLVNTRMHREVIAKQKLLIGLRVINILKLLPCIYFIGITGSLAMANTKQGDDIDFFIITQNNTLWITRFCILCLLQVLGKRREKYTTNARNKICVNLMLEESQLAFFSQEQTLYIAHEIVQVKPLFTRHNMYQKFLSANIWVTKFLPNTQVAVQEKKVLYTTETQPHLLVTFLNLLAKWIQLWYMKKHRTSEIITDTAVAFYGAKTQKRIVEIYEKKLRHYTV